MGKKNYFTIRNSNSSHLRSTDFQLRAFQFRERSLLYKLAVKFKELMDKGSHPFDALNKNLHIVILLGKAYGDRIILEQFVHNIQLAKQNISDSRVSQILTLLCSLFALWKIENDPFFLKASYMTGSKADSISEEINILCGEILPFIPSIVECIKSCPPVANAPIAGDWLNAFKF